MKLLEFLYFYLMPETPPPSGGNGSGGAQLQRSPSKRIGAFGGRNASGMGGEGVGTRTTEEKQGLLGRYLNNVEDLVEDLRESAPFGVVVSGC